MADFESIFRALVAVAICSAVVACGDRQARSKTAHGEFFRPIGDLLLLSYSRPVLEGASERDVMLVPDSKIAYDVQAKIGQLPVEGGQVVVRVEGQVVVLTGHVSSGTLADEIEVAARSVPGVRDVLNRIEY